MIKKLPFFCHRIFVPPGPEVPDKAVSQLPAPADPGWSLLSIISFSSPVFGPIYNMLPDICSLWSLYTRSLYEAQE